MENHKLLKYLAAGSALSFVNLSNAEIVYVDVDPDQSIQGLQQTKNQDNDFFDIIIDGDTVMQVGNNNKYWTTGSEASSGFWNGVWASGYYYNNGLNSSTNNALAINTSTGNNLPKVINNGETIGATNDWFSYGVLANYSYNTNTGGGGLEGNFHNVTDKYVGARFNVNGEVHYGWMRFDVLDSAKNFTFKDYAYQDCPGVSIFAGQKSDTIEIFGCDTATFNGKMYMSSGIVYDSIVGFSSGNCIIDSLLPIRVKIGSSVDTTDVIINEGDSVMLGGAYQTQSGLYLDSLKSKKGCDSLVYSNLGIIADPDTLSISDKLENISVYPNPSEGVFNVDLSKFGSNVEIILIDNTGRLIKKEQLSNKDVFNLNIEKSGLYFLKVVSDNKSEIIKLIKN